MSDVTLRIDQDPEAAGHVAGAWPVLGRIQRAGYRVYLRYHGGTAVCVARRAGEPRILVGADKDGNPYAAAMQVAEKVGLTPLTA